MIDFEVFLFDWLVVIIDYNTRKKKVIINNRKELVDFYNKAKDKYIWVGFNSRNYDSTILKAIILGMNPKEINDKLIIEGMKPHQISRKFNDILLYTYDTMVDRNSSLKQLEGMMGHMIKESGVNFNIDRKLTQEELNEYGKAIDVQTDEIKKIVEEYLQAAGIYRVDNK